MARWRSDSAFDADHAIGSGECSIDAFADSLLSSSNSSATRQFIGPEFHLSVEKNATANRIEYFAADPWTFEISCYQLGGAGNREHLPHIPNVNLEHSLWRN